MPPFEEFHPLFLLTLAVAVITAPIGAFYWIAATAPGYESSPRWKEEVARVTQLWTSCSRGQKRFIAACAMTSGAGAYAIAWLIGKSFVWIFSMANETIGHHLDVSALNPTFWIASAVVHVVCVALAFLATDAACKGASDSDRK